MSEMEAEGKVRVEVGEYIHGSYRGETVVFEGEFLDRLDYAKDVYAELYACPKGYRVYVDDGSESGQYLHPYETNPVTGGVDYEGLRYSAEQVAERWPLFASTLGVSRVRYIT
ncbi:MAG: hypothetical protein M3Q49_08520 [Actinomycetota bacterium]|nr:hypothetical protein [Actinomycetota bacterium]